MVTQEWKFIKVDANRILARLLTAIKDECEIGLVSIEGGSKTNAIPRNGEMVLCLNKEEESNFKGVVNRVEKQIQNELKVSDSKFEIMMDRIDDKIDKVLSEDVLNKTIAALMLIPTGVQSMSMDIEGLVESSNNIGIVKTLDDKITIESAMRSSQSSLKANISRQIKIIADMINGNWESYSSYPAWEYKKDSAIREIFKRVYKVQYGKDIKVTAIHAGLECGLFAEKFDDMDMISFGPDMTGVHTPEEKLSISSTERTYDLLINVLKEIK